jgi:signal transduction histidine kinase
MKTKSRKFESVVQLGLFIIIFVLLLLNVCSNYVIYHVWEGKRTQAAADFKNDGLVISRNLQISQANTLSDSLQRQLKVIHNLSSATLISSPPDGADAAANRKWLTANTGRLATGRAAAVAEHLLNHDFNRLIRGQEQEYLYAYSFSSATGKKLLVLSKQRPVLAYLDRSGKVILIFSISSMVIILALYLLLSRYIVSPFKRIKKQAIEAGRDVGGDSDDVEALVADYDRIIQELKEKESELLRLNEAITSKADRLEQFNEYLVSSITSGILTVDLRGKILSINAAAARLLQADVENAVGADISTVIAAGTELDNLVAGTLTSCRSQAYQELPYDIADRESLVLGVMASPIYDDKSRVIGACIMLNDRTELERLRLELEANNRLVALGEMAGGLAHQLRNSMGAILGYGSLVKKRLSRHSLSTDCVAALEQEAKEAEALIQRFLQFARPLQPQTQSTALRDLMNEIIEAVKVRPDCHDICFDLRCDDRLEVELDRLLFKQAVSNIIDNAVNAYRGRGGEIRIKADIAEDSVLLEIADSGSGIPDENLDKIFTPFFSSNPSGTGLGLPLAGRIIDAHGGRLFVASTEGEGTVFSIVLPSQVTSELSRPPAHPVRL